MKKVSLKARTLHLDNYSIESLFRKLYWNASFEVKYNFSYSDFDVSVCASDVLLMKKTMSDVRKILLLIFIRFHIYICFILFHSRTSQQVQNTLYIILIKPETATAPCGTVAVTSIITQHLSLTAQWSLRDRLADLSLCLLTHEPLSIYNHPKPNLSAYISKSSQPPAFVCSLAGNPNRG